MSEWDLEISHYGEALLNSAHIRITKHHDDNMGIGYGCHITKKAMEALGDPAYVRFYINRARRMVKIEPCNRLDKSARKVRGKHAISGAPSLVKRYGLPLGYYIMTDEVGVFAWRLVDDV